MKNKRHIHMHILKKRAINLKGTGGVYMGRFQGKRDSGKYYNYIIFSKTTKYFFKI